MTEQLNGWSVGEFTGAIDAVRQQPEAGKLTWRSHVAWDGGFGLDVNTQGIEQMGETMPRRFTLRGDHPPALLGENTGPTAIETLLAALGACMAGTFAAQATARGVAVQRLDIDVTANLDLNGFFGLQEVSPAISGIELVFRADVDNAAMRDEILEAAKAHSPVFNTVTRPIPIVAEFA